MGDSSGIVGIGLAGGQGVLGGLLKEEAGKTVDPHLQQTFDTLIRGTLTDDPAAWDRMVEQANQFMQGLDAPGDRQANRPLRESPGGSRETAEPVGV